MKELLVVLPFESKFEKYNYRYDQTRYNKISAEFHLNSDQSIWRNQYFFSTYQGSKLVYIEQNSWSRWILEKSKGLTRIGVNKLSESVRAYAYLILYAQANAKSSIIGNNSQSLDAQNILLNSFECLIDNQVTTVDDIKRFQDVLQHARSKIDHPFAEGVYMIPSDMKLRINKIDVFNKILVPKPGFKVGVNKQVNYTTKPLPKHEKNKKPIHHKHQQQQQQKNDGKLLLHERVLAKEHKDEKTAITFLIGIGGYLIWYFLR